LRAISGAARCSTWILCTGNKRHRPRPREIPLELVTLFCVAPVVTLEQDVELKRAPDFEFVAGHGRKRRIDVTDTADDFEPFAERYDRRDAFVRNQHIVRDDPCDKEVALIFGLTKQIDVADVEEVEAAGCIADASHQRISRSFVKTIGKT
jgi:hypothetical protein